MAGLLESWAKEQSVSRLPTVLYQSRGGEDDLLVIAIFLRLHFTVEVELSLR